MRGMLLHRTLVIGIVGALGAMMASVFAQEPATLVVQAYGGQWEEGLRKAVIEPFEQEYNVKVEVVLPGSSTNVLAKLRAERDNPTMDVVLIGGGTETIAANEGLFELLDFANIPNYADIYDAAKSPVEGYGPSVSFVSFQLAYNTERVVPAPTSWEVLWDPQYAGKVGTSGIESNAGVMLLYLMNSLAGGDISNVDAGFEKLKALNDNGVIYWTGVAEAQTMFVQEEIYASIMTDGRISGLAREGFPVEMVCPTEGCFVTYTYANVVKGSEQKELAEAFINQFLEPESQRIFAETGGNGPVNRHTELDPETARWVIYGPEQVESLISVPWDVVIDYRDEWIERWNREVLGGQ